VTTTLSTTRRIDLRKGSGANTHFCFAPSVYAIGGTPNSVIVKALIDCKVGFIRERWWPKNVAQQKAFATLADAGVKFYLFVGDVHSTVEQVRAETAELAASPIAGSVLAVCGANEPNAAGGDTWPAKVVSLQQAISTEARKHSSLNRASIVGPALKHNVHDVDHDYLALAQANVGRWCESGDFHFYPGNAGPSDNAKEETRARQAYGGVTMWHSETGWTGADTDGATAGRFSVEALLRNRLSGIAGTVLYEFADESQYVQGREGLFGMRMAEHTKPAFTAVKTLLATPDGSQPFVGWLGAYSKGVPSDTDHVVTSEGQGHWTVYLLRDSQHRAALVLPLPYTVDRGEFSTGPNGERIFTVALTETMTTVHVMPRS
jgi:hypothetical protein